MQNDRSETAARAVSRLEPADDGAQLLADSRDRRRIARSLTLAIIGAAIMAGGSIGLLLSRLIAQWSADGEFPARASRTLLYVARRNPEISTELVSSAGLALMAAAIWRGAGRTRSPGSRLTLSPRRIVRLLSPIAALAALSGVLANGYVLLRLRETGRSPIYDPIWTTSTVAEQLLLFAAVPCFLAAVLLFRAWARGMGANHLDCWMARYLWIGPALAYLWPIVTNHVLVFTGWHPGSEDHVTLAHLGRPSHDVLVLLILIWTRLRIARASIARSAPLCSRGEEGSHCDACGYPLPTADATQRCPECGVTTGAPLRSSRWLRTARYGVALIVLGSLTQLAVWAVANIPGFDRRISVWESASYVINAFASLGEAGNIAGWWLVVGARAVPTSDHRLLALQRSARIGMALIAAGLALSASLLVLSWLDRDYPLRLYQVEDLLVIIGAMLWWWPACGRTIDLAIDLDDRRTMRAALAAFWFLPCFAVFAGVGASAGAETDIWSGAASALSIARRPLLFDVEYMGPNAWPWWGIQAILASAASIVCAIAYLTYLIVLHRAFRRAERRARTPSP